MTALAAVRGGSTAGRTWLGALGVVAVAASLVWVAGPAGLAVGAAVALGWWWLPAPYAVVAGHVLALPVLPPGLAVAPVVAMEAGFLGIVGGPAVRGPDRLSTVTVLGLGGIGLGAVAWVGWHAWEPRWPAGAAVVAVVAVASYGLHRYSVVALEDREAVAPP